MSFWRDFVLVYISMAILPLSLLFGVSGTQFVGAQLLLWWPRFVWFLYEYCIRMLTVRATRKRVNMVRETELTMHGHTRLYYVPLRDTGIVQYQPERAMGRGIRGVYQERYVCTVDLQERLNNLLRALALDNACIYWRRTWIGFSSVTRSTCAVCESPCRPSDSGTSPFLVTDYMCSKCAIRRVLVPFVCTRYLFLACMLANSDIASRCVPLWVQLCYDASMEDLNPA